MNIYKHELKANFKSMILWTSVLSGVAALMMCFYPALKNDMDNFIRILDNLPAAMKAVFGLAVKNFSTSIGFYSFIFTYSMLFGAIQAMNLGVSIMSKEERERTADFLMTKPVTRVHIMTSKLLAVLTILVATNIIYTGVSGFLTLSFAEGDFPAGKFALLNGSLFFAQLFFFSIGLIVSVGARKIKSVLPVSLGIVLMFFAISAFAVTSSEDKLRYITPFQYFKADYIIAEGQYEPVFAIIGAIIIAVCIAASYSIYTRKNIHAV